MAREIDEDMMDDNELESDKGKKKGKLVTSLIAVFIVLIWIAIFAVLIKLDVGGFGSSVLRPILKDVPVINMILPDATDSEISSESGNVYSTLEEAIARINELEDEVTIYKENSDTSAATISTLTAEVERLQTYEENQTYYEELRKQFDEEVVYTDNAPDITEYKAWYEEMYPENADEIYRQVTEQLAMDQVVQDLSDYYSSMKAANAATILSEMTGDLDKVANILTGMKSEQAGDILAAMDSTLAAKVTLLMYPTTE